MTNNFLKDLFARRGGMKLGIGRVAAAFPQVIEKEMPVYHVAGTNGKGTTVYALSHILSQNDFVTGRFVSPHLLEFNERISVNGADITDEEAQSIYKWLEEKVDVFKELSFFEITFLMAWKHFEFNNCDRVVIEVGLGGRLDATNVISWSKTDIITSIGLDHTHILGSTKKEIASEKMGIIKDGDRVLLGKDEDDEFAKWMEDECLKRGALQVLTIDEKDFPETVKTLDMSEVQKKNAALAYSAVKVSGDMNTEPDFKGFFVPGRFQKIGKNIILDVAHNPPAIEKLVDTISSKVGNKVNFLYGSMKDKDITSVLLTLGKVASKIFTVSVDEENRGAKVPDITSKSPLSIASSLIYETDDIATIERAVAESEKEGVVLVVTGSFYTVEKFLRWKNEKDIS